MNKELKIELEKEIEKKNDEDIKKKKRLKWNQNVLN